VALISNRLPHVLTRSDLAELLTPTYAREVGVSDELALERMARALKNSGIADKLYNAVSGALVAVRGERTEDALMDGLSKAVPKKLRKVRAAPGTPALTAVTVWVNVEIGLASEDLRGTLESGKGRTLLDQGFRVLGEFLVKQLLG